MRRMTPLLLIAVLTGCGPSEAPKPPNLPTVEELAADPTRLKELGSICIKVPKVPQDLAPFRFLPNAHS